MGRETQQQRLSCIYVVLRVVGTAGNWFLENNTRILLVLDT